MRKWIIILLVLPQMSWALEHSCVLRKPLAMKTVSNNAAASIVSINFKYAQNSAGSFVPEASLTSEDQASDGTRIVQTFKLHERKSAAKSKRVFRHDHNELIVKAFSITADLEKAIDSCSEEANRTAVASVTGTIHQTNRSQILRGNVGAPNNTTQPIRNTMMKGSRGEACIGFKCNTTAPSSRGVVRGNTNDSSAPTQ